MVNLTPYLKAMLNQPPTLTADDMVDALNFIIKGGASDIQIAAFLTALRITGIDHSADFIAAAAWRIFQESHKIDHRLIKSTGYIDVVGTGGDGKNTFNVSTTAAIVAAGMGMDICKHGGKASTSASGAGDLLPCLGVATTKVTHLTAPRLMEKSKFCFLFAPMFHPIMASLAPLRKTLGIPTIFNILGPLLNPAPLKSRIIGVYAENLGQVFAEAVLQMNTHNNRPDSTALVVWGTEGLDEISPAGMTKVWELRDGKITQYYLHPSDFGLPTHSLEDVASGTPQENAVMVNKLINNELPENHPILDYVVMNAAALAVISNEAENWKKGVELARQSITSGEAKAAFEAFAFATQEL